MYEWNIIRQEEPVFFVEFLTRKKLHSLYIYYNALDPQTMVSKYVCTVRLKKGQTAGYSNLRLRSQCRFSKMHRIYPQLYYKAQCVTQMLDY